MATDLLESGYAEAEASGSQMATSDIDRLVDQIERHASRITWYLLVERLCLAFAITSCLWVVANLVLFGPDLLISVVSTAGLIVAVTGGAIAFVAEQEKRRVKPTLLAMVNLLRQTAPALVQQGNLSELRWATIKIQLSRYGI